MWLGARRGTNNTAEISAIGEACRWLLSLIHDLPVYHSRKITIYYDSEYAYGVTTRLTKCKDNHELVESVAQLVSATRNQFHLTFQHVKGHLGIHGNEVADKLADRGFLGRVSPHATFWTIRPEGPLGRPPAPAPKRAPRVLRRPAAAGPRQGRHPLLPCPVCGENFRSCDLPQHQPGCRGPDLNLRCQYCNTLFTNLQTRKNHDRYSHPTEALRDGLISHIAKKARRS